MRDHPTALAGSSRHVRTILGLALVLTLAAGTIASLVGTSSAPSPTTASRPPAPPIEVDVDGLQMSTGDAKRDAAIEFAHTHGHGPAATSQTTSAARTAGTATPARVTTGGYTPDVAAIRKNGYVVVVPSNITGRLYSSIVTVVRQMSSVGVPLRISRSSAGTQAYIRVYLKSCTGNLLGITSRVQGGIWNDETRAWVITSYRATVGICTRTTKMSGTWLTATVQHEFGHAVGLGHYTTTYGGSYQIMKPVLSSGMINFRSGDVAGLRHLVAGAPRG